MKPGALIAALAAALLVAAAPAAARRLDRPTAFRYALTAPMPASPSRTPVRDATVSSCRRVSARAFTCSVTVRYEPVPPSDPNVRTSAPQCEYSVRVAYAAARSRRPVARRVGAVTCPA